MHPGNYAKIGFLILLLMQSFFATAQTGENLMKGVEAYDAQKAGEEDISQLDLGIFMGLVRGVALTGHNRFFCLPNDWVVAQGLEVVSVHLKAHPEIWSQSDGVIVAASFKDVWPCPEHVGA